MELILVQHEPPRPKELSTCADACRAIRSVITIDETSHLRPPGVPTGPFQRG